MDLCATLQKKARVGHGVARMGCGRGPLRSRQRRSAKTVVLRSGSPTWPAPGKRLASPGAEPVRPLMRGRGGGNLLHPLSSPLSQNTPQTVSTVLLHVVQSISFCIPSIIRTIHFTDMLFYAIMIFQRFFEVLNLWYPFI